MNLKANGHRLGLALLILGLVSMVLSGCTSLLLDKKSSVRFQNLTDFNIFYGVKFGEAEYIGPVGSGFTTGYLSTAAGTYSLQAMNASSQWVTISSGSMSISSGHTYTIVGTGTGGYYYWVVVQDS